MLHPTPLPSFILVMVWSPPSDPWVSVNFDASFFVDLQAAGVGVVIRNTVRLLLGSTCFWHPWLSSPLVIEAMAYVQALKFTRDLGFRSIEVERDSTSLVSKLHVPDIDRSVISPLVWEVKQLPLAFTRIRFQHIRREGNTVAHLLAKEGFLQCYNFY